MKTLSNDITLLLDTSNLTPGYATTTVYYGSKMVFVGKVYVDEQHSPVEFCLNDFIMQNHGRNDFLKLNNDGELVSNGLNTHYEQLSKFEQGQVGEYSVSLVDSDSYLISESSTAVAAYDYPNKDIKPTILNADSSSDIGRLIQGSDWYVKHEDERGVFNDLLVPHLPAKPTKKFGMGLQIINAGQIDYPFVIRPSYGANEVSLGYTEGPSDATFVTLYDIYQNTSINDAEDTSIFLKYQGTSGDEFGDWQEGYELYTGDVYITGIRVETVDAITTETTVEDIPVGSTEEQHTRFVLALYDYNAINHTQDILDQSKIINNSPVYTTDENSHRVVDNQIDNFVSEYIKRTRTSRMDNISVYMTPLYERDLVVTGEVSSEYVGKCVVGIIDRCYSRYYLAWSDRYGDIMSQPFDGKFEYSEDFNKTEIKDYKLRRRIITNNIKPSWQLNTKWLNEDIYPMYEAIFTSPYLLLYDAETDRAWNVIVTNNKYNEKNHNNQKSLFNLQLNVEANTEQNYIF